MYIDIVPNRNSPPAVLLRESYRENGRIIKRTIANLSKCPPDAIESFRLALRGVKLTPQADRFIIERSIPFGHVEALLGLMNSLKMDTLLSSRPCRERSLVLAMIAQRLLDPCSKLSTTRQWHSTALAEELSVADADENDLYAALDWLLDRQERIEDKLAKRHLHNGGHVLFDVSSSSYHGRSCPLASYGYNRDGEKLPCIVYGLLTDEAGRPVAVETYPGNTADSETVAGQVDKLRIRFNLDRVVLVGDRGMLPQSRIDEIKKIPQLGWITALRSSSIRELLENGVVQMSLFDQRNLAEITCEEYPGERLVACYNPLLAIDRRHTREDLLLATEEKLALIAAEVKRRIHKQLLANEIGIKVGKVLSRYKMGKHFILDIQNGAFSYQRNTVSIEKEECLDGIYIIRTSEDGNKIAADDIVRTYKSLGQVEQAFRCIKNLDIRIRPIHHRTEPRVKAHIFLCMLAYYVEWHLRKSLAPVLFQDDELDVVRWQRDPVAKAMPGEKAKKKKSNKQTEDGWPVQSLHTLLDNLGTRCMNTCRVDNDGNVIRFKQITQPTPFQHHSFGLLGISLR